MANFYAARSNTSLPPPWSTFTPPFTLEAAASGLERSVSEIGKLEGISEEARRRAVEVSNQFLNTISSIEREMKGLDASMAAVFSKTSDGLGVFQSQAEGIAGAMDKQFAKAVDRLANAVQKLPIESGETREAAE